MKAIRSLILDPNDIAEAIKDYVEKIHGWRPVVFNYHTTVNDSNAGFPHDAQPIAVFHGAIVSEDRNVA